VKRTLDVALVLLALPVLLPAGLLSALLVRRRLGSPVLFRQMRPGRGGRLFELVKFRSMRDAAGADGLPLEDEERLTPFGRKLRSTSLDELPTLVNVLRGDMSLVGPRPLLPEYLPLYTAEQARRHVVRPGITGWAQINGRNNLSWPEKLALDVWYVDNRSLRLDARILLATIGKVWNRDGISAADHATMSRFTGREPESKCVDPDPIGRSGSDRSDVHG